MNVKNEITWSSRLSVRSKRFLTKFTVPSFDLGLLSLMRWIQESEHGVSIFVQVKSETTTSCELFSWLFGSFHEAVGLWVVRSIGKVQWSSLWVVPVPSSFSVAPSCGRPFRFRWCGPVENIRHVNLCSAFLSCFWCGDAFSSSSLLSALGWWCLVLLLFLLVCSVKSHFCGCVYIRREAPPQPKVF